jgi:hypothetical protein
MLFKEDQEQTNFKVSATIWQPGILSQRQEAQIVLTNRNQMAMDANLRNAGCTDNGKPLRNTKIL